MTMPHSQPPCPSVGPIQLEPKKWLDRFEYLLAEIPKKSGVELTKWGHGAAAQIHACQWNFFSFGQDRIAKALEEIFRRLGAPLQPRTVLFFFTKWPAPPTGFAETLSKELRAAIELVRSHPAAR